jgi:hypothetical protein
MLRKFGILTLATGLLALLPTLARADNLDKKLNDSAPEIVNYIKDNGYKNVGILRFRAQRGNQPESFSTGPINGNLAERLENLLIIHAGDEKGPTFGVIHDAGVTAQQEKVGSWFSNEAARTKLFGVSSYPLAWGTNKVTADVFLTGKVATTADLKKTTVTLQAFSKASLKPAKVVEFTVATDASLVRDMGYSFALTTKQKSGLVKSRGEDEGELVLEQANKQQPPQQPKPTEGGEEVLIQPKAQPSAFPTDVAGIEMKILSGKDAVKLDQAGTQWSLECPPKGKPITITLTNKSPKQLGVVLKVAGMNTIGQDKKESVLGRKWVIPAGETFTIEGYHVGEKFENLKPFAVLDSEDADRKIEELGEKAQTIEVDVFDAVAVKKPALTISRGLPPQAKGQPAPTFTQLRDEVLKQSNLSRVRSKDGKWVIADDKDTKPGPELKEVDFPKNPACIGSLQLRVMPPKSSGSEEGK